MIILLGLVPVVLLLGPGALVGARLGLVGGFLIVPRLILATEMRLQNAIGTSLFAMTVFGAAAALS